MSILQKMLESSAGGEASNAGKDGNGEDGEDGEDGDGEEGNNEVATH